MRYRSLRPRLRSSFSIFQRRQPTAQRIPQTAVFTGWGLRRMGYEAAIGADDYDAQSAVERELVLRLAGLLWPLRRGTKMETGLFEIQANHMREFRRERQGRRMS
jgi:hypothetical protein